MDIMINLELVKNLRKQKSWSQDQLASISGISLRTVQRIEKEGTCSLESKKALASAFGIDAADLELDYEAIDFAAANHRGQKYGYAGAVIGFIGAYIGITLDWVNGGMSSGEAGMFYGGVAVFFGICCAAIGFRSRNQLHKRASSNHAQSV